MKACLEVREDGSEVLHYDFEGHPVRTKEVRLEEYAGAVGTHIHEELEFVLIRSGSMSVELEGEVLSLKSGQGIFLNARRSHRFFSGENCRFFCLQVHPMLLCTSSYVEEHFVLPFLSDDSFPYVLLSGETSWESRILKDVETISSHREEGEVLDSQLLLFEIWRTLYRNVFEGRRQQAHVVKERRYTILKAMTDYIRQHYSQKIKLDDIARAGGVQKTSCSNLFRYYLGESPISYLTAYRIRAGAKLLRTSNATVTDITYAVGFSSTSYFVRTFREIYQCTPLQYRSAQARQSEKGAGRNPS